MRSRRVGSVSPVRLWLLFTFCIGLAVVGCTPSDEDQQSSKPDSSAGLKSDSTLARKDSTHAPFGIDSTKLIPDSELKFPLIHYSQLYISTKSILDSVRHLYGKKKDTIAPFRAITTLNRKEFGYIRIGDTIVVPDTVMEDLRAYSVFPVRYPAADTIRKLIMVSNKYQAYACYEYGRLRRFVGVNTGSERKPTLPGRYALNWKALLKKSSLNDEWELPFTFNFHQYAGNAFHQFVMPGRPVSHSCIRQFQPDAQWLFNWGEGSRKDSSGKVIPMSGTPVIIVDIFDFNRKKGGPWLDLTSNKDSLIVLPANPLGIEEALIPISQVPVKLRNGLPNKKRYLYAEDTLRARGLIREGVSLSSSIDYNERRAERAAAKKKD